MKILFILLSITLLNKDCSPKQEQEKTSIVYTASSRGSYFQALVKNDNISVSRQRDAAPIFKSYPEAFKKNLLLELNKINIEQLQNFEAPSKNHLFDGAKIAFLEITKNNKTYKSTNFDHNNPPKEIAAIVKEILSIVENIE